MATETIYVPTDVYHYALRTLDDGQSIGQRLQELAIKGAETEGFGDE